MTTHRVALDIELPTVEHHPLATAVTCGSTSVRVSEHGVTGSGNWVVWTSGGHTAKSDHKRRTYAEALDFAEQYVRSQELRRLLHGQVNDVLTHLEA